MVTGGGCVGLCGLWVLWRDDDGRRRVQSSRAQAQTLRSFNVHACVHRWVGVGGMIPVGRCDRLECAFALFVLLALGETGVPRTIRM